MTAVRRRIEEVVTHLCFARPYFASGVYAMRPVICEETLALAVDDYWRIYINPDWLMRYSVGQAASAFAHELQHLLCDHAGRAKAAGVSYSTMHIWSRESCDPEINAPLMVDCRTCQPILAGMPEDWCVLPSHFGLPDNKLAEFYFAERLKVREVRAGGGVLAENGGRGDGGRGRAGRGSGEGEGTELDFGCGSGATGIQAPWDVGSPAESGVDGLDDADVWGLRRQVARDVIAYQARGTTPLGLLAWAKEITRVKTISWDALLASAVRRATVTVAGTALTSYARPSRRQHAFGRVIAPAYRRPVPNIVLIADTSGSMDHLRATARGVVDSACRRLGVPLRVIDVDVDVHRDVFVSSGRFAVQSGGGGTDMCAGIDRANERGGCDVVVVVTDCDTDWPVKRPRSKLIVVAVGATRESINLVPAWATVVEAVERKTP